jgi:hypothetical protein
MRSRRSWRQEASRQSHLTPICYAYRPIMAMGRYALTPKCTNLALFGCVFLNEEVPSPLLFPSNNSDASNYAEESGNQSGLHGPNWVGNLWDSEEITCEHLRIVLTDVECPQNFGWFRMSALLWQILYGLLLEHRISALTNETLLLI